MERKLSTIFASDVVGFSRMTGENEKNLFLARFHHLSRYQANLFHICGVVSI